MHAVPPNVRSDDGPLRGAQTVHRALQILESFSPTRPALALAELSQAVGLTVPTTHRLLRALQEKEFVVQDPNTKYYSLGPSIIRMAAIVQGRDDVIVVAHPTMERLRDLSGESVGFHWLVGDKRVCAHELVSVHPLRMASGVGHSYPLVAGAGGKVILAALGEARRESILAAIDDVDLGELRRTLEKVRKQGYAISHGETVDNAAAIAVAVRRTSGEVVGAINVTGPASRLTAARLKELAPVVVEAGQEVMRQLGRVE
ncbi:MAG: IclR family transcriptional regulator, acetate operon repressor [Actinomycetia bacterium]|nr:IclR family transcriptional regulator, acetate operon repressor [Actinomycetes bacterium]